MLVVVWRDESNPEVARALARVVLLGQKAGVKGAYVQKFWTEMTRAMRVAVVAMLLSLLTLIPASAEVEPIVLRQPLANWVTLLPIPEVNPARMRKAEEGIYDLIQDTQIRIEPGQQFYVRRTVKKITDRSGMESAAQLESNFDPETDRLVLNRVIVVRDGQQIDLTKSASIEILRRETELDDGILTGDRTALVRLKDVRVGDVVDASWTWAEKRSYWPGHHFSVHDLGWSVPVGITRVVINAPSGMTLFHKAANGAEKPRISSANGRQEWLWIAKDPEPITGDEDTPEGYEVWPEVQLSSMGGWPDVVAWGLPLYAVDQTLPPDLAQKVDAVSVKYPGKMDRITEALRIVQDSVRYTSLSIGAGGYVPRPPAATWRNGFGDCKDKTVLLIAVLRRLGVAAVPALTDLDGGYSLDRMLPSATAFDHVIVRVENNGQPMWLDPTGSHQGGRAPAIAELNYGYALPLRPGQKGLEPMRAKTPDKPSYLVDETHRHDDKGISITVATTYLGDEADIRRSNLADTSRDKFEADELEYYERLYPGITQQGAFSISDHRDANRIIIKQAYRVPSSAEGYDDLVLAYPVNAWSFSEIYKQMDKAKRQAPLKLASQINRAHIVRVIGKDDAPGGPDDVEIEGTAFDFERTSSQDGAALTVSYTLKGKTDWLKASETGSYKAEASALDDALMTTLDLNNPFATPDIWGLLGLIIGVLGGVILLVLAVQKVFYAERANSNTDVLRPVGVAKFVILSGLSLSIYSTYWFWRCWRRYRATDGADIMPFWRAVFGVFWFMPLFNVAAAKVPAPPARAVIIGCTVVYVLTSVIAAVGDSAEAPFWQTQLFTLAGTLACVPLVQTVNAANLPENVLAASRFGWMHAMAALFGLMLTVTMLVMV